MRIIDADELPITETWALVNSDNKPSEGISFAPLRCILKKDIDNALTVEPCYQTTSCSDCKMYDKEKHNCPRFCKVIRDLVKEVEEKSTGGWITIEAGENLLENHEWYLIVHKDYETPMKAKYHSDCPHFTFFDARGEEVSYLFENKITHYMKLPDIPIGDTE